MEKSNQHTQPISKCQMAVLYDLFTIPAIVSPARLYNTLKSLPVSKSGILNMFLYPTLIIAGRGQWSKG